MPQNTNIISNSQVHPATESSGLQAMQQMQYMDWAPIQCKLAIGAVDDPLETEADAMADKVMRMPEQDFIQRKCMHCEEEERAQRKPLETFIQKKCAHCEEEEKKVNRKPLASFIQRKMASGTGATVDANIAATKGGGNPLAGDTKTFMESRFGADFSEVRIHADDHAAELSKELHAQAFTVGSNIYFNEGKYQPGSAEGKYLLAHELTHTIQQSGGFAGIQRKENVKPISESKEATEGGRTIKVERIITPGECKITKNSSSSASGDFKDSRVFFEAKGCKNNVTGEAYGDLDFKEFTDGAEKFIKAVPGALASGGNVSAGLSKEIDNDFKNADLKASLRLVLRVGHVRVEAKGTGSANLNQGYEAGVTGFIRYANGKFNIELGGGFDKTWSQLGNAEEAAVHLYTDIGPIIIRIDGKHTDKGTTIEGKIGDADLSKNHGIGVTYSDENGDKKIIFNFSFTLPEKIQTENAPDCVFCACEKPDIKFVCSDVTPGKPPDPPKKLERKYIPLFYNYATTDPRNDAAVPASEYDKTIGSIIQAIEEGYTIDHIEGYTSPEGPLDHKRGRFEGNEKLSTERAQKAADRIKERIAKLLASEIIGLAIMRDFDKIKKRLTDAGNKAIPVAGENEMYGADATSTDITENKLFGHLSKELKAPAADEQDILEKDRVKGEALPEELRDAAEKDISSFRTGTENDKRLTQDQRLQKLYPWLRRALVIMEPPAPELNIDISKITQDVIRQVIGTPVACTEAHLKLFADTPLPSNEKLIIDHCSTPKK